MFNNFYRGKKVMVTGVAGVKGPWLAQQLLDSGCTVVGVDIRLPTAESNFAASRLDERIEFTHGDVTDLDLLCRVMDGVDCVFHLAAVSLVSEARRNPLETYRSNTLGTVAVLEAIRRSTSVRHAVLVTTDKVYKPKDGGLWTETDPLVASEPYPVSKACAEFAIADYYQQYLKPKGVRIGIARAGNVLLGGDFYSSERMDGGGHLHVDCFEALARGESPAIFTPAFTRPYSYGLDILSGYMSLMSRLDDPGVDGEAFNFGPHERQGVANGVIASKICEIWGSNILWKASNPRQEPFDRQSMSWDKANERLGWQPAFTIYETLQQVAEWYRAWFALTPTQRAKGCMVDTNRQLIDAHRSAAIRAGIWWSTCR